MSYILATLRPPCARGDRDPGLEIAACRPGRLMLLEAFITEQRKTADTRSIEDAYLV